MIETIRHILSLPFVIIGSIVFKLADLISGDKYFYNYDECEKVLITKMVCSKCGHRGK